MRAARLELRIDSVDEGLVELIASVTGGEFTGCSSAWFGESQLAQFADELEATYPFSSEAPVVLEGGFWENASISQLHVGLRFYPIGHVGRIGCRIVLRTQDHGQDRVEPHSNLETELHTTYENVRRFSRQIRHLLAKDADVAVLASEA